ncbi:hypothetical protein [Pontibacillus salipaludis]|uniref:hypothetical protein n=1 Tax=Pontibacillus salipaludis TaxID=1697394 RepID=UPI0031EE9793
MEITILDKSHDNVINSVFITAKTTYSVALEKLVPLIDRLDYQRNTLKPQFYRKLEKDILNGCIMPPLTLAIKQEIHEDKKIENIEKFINNNIEDGFVLDGIQRLNTIKRICEKNDINLTRPLYLNILICNSMDKLLYRMITLNNGQKPMSARHQVEILASNLYNFEELPLNIRSEKEQKKKRVNNSFKKDDIIKSYLAFISNSINIDNQKIIESKLDELITDQIIESDLTERKIEFSEVVDLINTLAEADKSLLKWFKGTNNLIGFSAGIHKSFNEINEVDKDTFKIFIETFEEAFKFIDVSKIKLGLARRRAVKYLITNYSEVYDLSITKLTDIISQEV